MSLRYGHQALRSMLQASHEWRYAYAGASISKMHDAAEMIGYVVHLQGLATAMLPATGDPLCLQPTSLV